MKFYGEPNLLVRVRNNGPLKTVKNFRFDANGEFETENKYLIRTLVGKFKSDKEVVVENATTESIEYSEEQLRSMAKEQKIKSWHVKSIETLKEELGV